MIPIIMLAVGVWLVLAAQTATGQADVRDVLARLSSADLEERVAGTRALRSLVLADHSLLMDTGVPEAVTRLLETENHLVAASLEAAERGQPASIDEGFGEHYAVVLELADSLRPRLLDNPGLRRRLMAALVTGSYNPDSEFARGLALEGEPIVASVLDMARGGRGPDKWNAHAIIAMLFLHSSRGALREDVSPISRDALKRSARAGLRDPAADVRRHAIRAVVAEAEANEK